MTVDSVTETVQALRELVAPCHGYQNACVCPRCTDRSLRTQLYTGTDCPDPYALARDESAEYFATPWKFDNQTPPRRLGD